MSTVPADLGDYSDAELIAAVRDGENAAYGTLYERHVTAAYNLARQLAGSAAETDDLVSDAFAKVLDTLRAGKGPDSSFRAYLLTALRHGAYDKTRKDRRVDLTEDMGDAGGEVGAALTVPFADTAMSGLERSLAAKAFARLPERWQAVLWHTEIEQQSAAEVAPVLGLTANGVSALAYRAREGLRQAYLQVHLAETEAERCRATAERLGAWTRSGLSKRERNQVETHLDDCAHCRALAAELADVNGGLRGVVAPLVLGGAALAYLSAAGASKATAATVATTTGAAAAAGAAGSGTGSGAAAGAAATGPREFAGVATSAVAMVAAAALAVTAGGGSQDIPTPQQAAEAPAQQAPANPGAGNNDSDSDESDNSDSEGAESDNAGSDNAGSDNAGSDNSDSEEDEADNDGNDSSDPADEAPASDPDSPDSPSPEKPTSSQSPSPSDPTSPSESDSPQSPDISVDEPDDITLEPGGDPAELPITVRNDGDSKSEPVEATLNLPEGVQVVRSGGGGGAPMGGGAAPPAKTDSTPSEVRCPPSSGDTVSCSTDDGLEAAESVTLLFLLQADEDAESESVTGTVDDGDATPVEISVPVEVDEPEEPEEPEETDIDLEVTTSCGYRGLFFCWHPQLEATVTNTGDTSGEVEVTADMHHGETKDDSGSLDPDEDMHVSFKWWRLLHHPHQVSITATMGDVTRQQQAKFDSGWGLHSHPPASTKPDDQDAGSDPTSSSTSTESAESTSESSTESSTPTTTSPAEPSGTSDPDTTSSSGDNGSTSESEPTDGSETTGTSSPSTADADTDDQHSDGDDQDNDGDGQDGDGDGKHDAATIHWPAVAWRGYPWV